MNFSVRQRICLNRHNGNDLAVVSVRRCFIGLLVYFFQM
jgi:hypothetical protein